MTEPDVTLTDYALALECTLFAFLLLSCRGSSAGLRPWFVVFFGSVAAASVCGGTVHGFFLDRETWGYAVLWRAMFLAVGVTALASWVLGARLLSSPRVARWITLAALVAFLVYSVIVLSRATEFWIALLMVFPAHVFLAAAFVRAYLRERHRSLRLAVCGFGLSFLASVLQQLGVGIHPSLFNHNALYHVLQAIALFLFFLGARRMLVAESRRTCRTGIGD